MPQEFRDDAIGPGVAAGGTFVDPVEIGSAATAPEPERTPGGRKKRADAGKPRGSRAGAASGTGSKTKAQVALDLSSLQAMFVGAHVMLAAALQTPEFAISEDEGRSFAQAASNVMRHYNVQTTQKTVDWIALIGISAQIYVPRIIAVSMKPKEPRTPNAPHIVVGGRAKPEPKAEAAVVYPFYQPPTPQDDAGFTG